MISGIGSVASQCYAAVSDLERIGEDSDENMPDKDELRFPTFGSKMCISTFWRTSNNLLSTPLLCDTNFFQPESVSAFISKFKNEANLTCVHVRTTPSIDPGCNRNTSKYS